MQRLCNINAQSIDCVILRMCKDMIFGGFAIALATTLCHSIPPGNAMWLNKSASYIAAPQMKVKLVSTDLNKVYLSSD